MTKNNNRPVFRFAPSPNGFLHLGHAFSALYSWQMARKYDGVFLLRIEDIDQARSRHIYIDQICDDLNWLGLSWPEPVLYQSTRFEAYQKALDVLRSKDLIYPSYLTRQDIKDIPHTRQKDPDGAPLITRSDEPQKKEGDLTPSWRLDMDKAISALEGDAAFTEHDTGPAGEMGLQKLTPEIWGNVVLSRKDISTSYHLSVVVDDAFQQVSHVTRGHDLFYATHIHVLLQKILGYATPRYFHHPLIADDEGRKLSKSVGDKSLKSLREEGITRDDILSVFKLNT